MQFILRLAAGPLLVILMLCASIPLSAQTPDSPRTVSGTVTEEETGDPLIGATVLVKNAASTTGTVSNIDGRFTITVPGPEAILLITYTGFSTTEVRVGDETELSIRLGANSSVLDEVVVVGYGTQRKSDVTGAIGIVSSKELLNAPVTNALQGLAGRVAGVNVFLNSGSPTGSPRILIRGLGTINASSNPLFVVDGVVMEDIQFLNPNDIKSVEVLKDASATAIYGARGANGVVLVTTQRGPASEGIIIGYDGFVSAGTLRKKMDLLNSEEWLEVVRTGMENAPLYRPGTAAPEFTTNDPDLFDEDGNPLYDTDWQDEATRTAISHNHQLSVRQRTDKASYGIFMNYSRNEGIMLNNYLERMYGKVNYEGNPKDWLTVGFNLLTNVTKENSFQEGGGGQVPRRTMIEMPPIFPVRFPDGGYANVQMIDDRYNLEAMANPVHVLETQDRLAKRTQLFGNAYLVFHLAEGLDLRTQFGFDKHERIFQFFSPTDLINISFPLGSASASSNRVNYWQQENYLNYDRQFGKHSLNGVAGLSWQERVGDGFGGSTRGFTDNFFRFNNLGAGSQPNPPGSFYDEWSINSYFLRAGYNYDSKYLVTLTGRLDGSSRFGDNNKYGLFPSVGLGWVLSNEPFLENSRSIDNLKIRTSFGITGNTEIATYRSLGTGGSFTTLINGERAPATVINRIANPNLEWEKTRQFDAGISLNMFNYRLGIEVDYYYKITNDLLLARPIPLSTGFGSVFDNIGSVSNRGIEVALTTTNVNTNNLRWTTTLNFNYNRNRIEKLGENDEDIFPGPGFVSGSNTILRVGEPVSTFWGFRRLGTWNSDEADEASEVGAVPGEARRSEQREIIGNGLPDWTGSLINNVRLGNFDFSADLQFVFGVDVLQNFLHSTEDRSGIANGLRTILTDGWTPDNQDTPIQQIRNQAFAGQNSVVDDHWVANGSYVRGNAFTLGYTLPTAKIGGIGLRSLRVYATAQNAFVLHSDEFKGLDPQGTSYGGQFSQNIFFFQYPPPRTFTFGVNLTF